MNHHILAFCVSFGCAASLTAASVTTNGTVISVSVESGATLTCSETLASPITSVVKTGAGTAKFSAASTNFTGSFTISEGIADFTVLYACGRGPIEVRNGAAMYVSHASAGQMVEQVLGTLTIAGSGPDGRGALKFTGTGMADRMFKDLVLGADASWGGNRSGASSLDMQGHTLTWTGGNHMSNACAWKNFGAYIHDGMGDLCFQSATFDSTCTEDKTITLANGTGYISFWGCKTPIPFTLVVNGNSRVRANSGSSTGACVWNGPVRVPEGRTLRLQTADSAKMLNINGPITGKGAISFAENSGTTYLNSTANAWEGGTTLMNGGKVVVPASGALPGYNVKGRIVQKDTSNLLLSSVGPNAWSCDDIAAYGTNVTAVLGTTLGIQSGSLMIDSGAFLHTSNLNVSVGADNNTTPAKITIADGGTWSAIHTNLLNLGRSVSYPGFFLGDSGTKPAVLEILDGGSWTGKFYGVASSTSQKAAVYLKGGEFVQYSGPVADGYFANKGYLYLGQTGGTLKMRAHTGMMSNTGAGVYELRGGRFQYISSSGCQNFTLSRGNGHGELYQTGGVFDSAAIGHPFRMAVQDYSAFPVYGSTAYASGGLSLLTLNGADALMKCSFLDMGYKLTNAVSIVNLMAGVLECRGVRRDRDADFVGCHAFVNLNGGTIRATGDISDLFGTSERNACERVTVLGKGAVIDTNGKSVTVQRVPLSAPDGKGVVALAFPASASCAGYIGAPEVTITGDGMGASAHCCWNAETGVIGPLVVTSPGQNYTTATATIKNADRTQTVNLTVTLGVPAGGGLVKRGAGTLTLASANSYTGATRVEAGTLKLAVARAIPPSNDLVLAGGTLDLNGIDATFARAGGTGAVTNGTLTVTSGLVFDGTDLLTNAVFDATTTALTLPQNPDVKIVNEDLLPADGTVYTLATFPSGTFTQAPATADTGRWVCTVSEDGSTLLLVRRPDVVLDKARPRAGAPIGVLFPNGAGSPCAYEWYKAGWNGEFAATPFATTETVTLTEDDYEHWVKVVVHDAYGVLGEDRLFFSRLPVCYIEVANGATPSPAKEEHDATVRIQGNDAYKAQYEGSATIKVRGNSTKGYPKKPWKLKLGTKTDVFGLGGGTKNKHWVLLANYLDECLMRNTTGSRLADALGVLNMKTEWVDVVLNGSYNGCYQFCQHIRIGAERVNVFDWESAGEDIASALYKSRSEACSWTDDDKSALKEIMSSNFGWVTSGTVPYRGVDYPLAGVTGYSENMDISGGYLFEFSSEYDEASKFITASGTLTMKTMLNKPEFLCTSPAMMGVCQDYLQRFWDACQTANGYNGLDEHWSQLCDVDSMTGYWLTMVLMGNSDSGKKSRFASIDRGQKLVFGPVWDFDWGCGSPVTVKTNSVAGGWYWSGATNDWSVAITDGQDDQNTTKGGFYKEWADDPWFCLKLWEKYWDTHDYFVSLFSDGGLIDRWQTLLAEAGAANEAKWRYRVGFSGPDGDVARFKRYLRDRFDWLDRQFASVDQLMTGVNTSKSSVPYIRATTLAPSVSGAAVRPVADSAESQIVDVANRVNRAFTVELAVPAGATVELYVNGLAAGAAEVEGRKAAFRVPAGALTAPAGKRNCLSFIAKDAAGAVVARNYAFVLSSEAGIDGFRFLVK